MKNVVFIVLISQEAMHVISDISLIKLVSIKTGLYLDQN